EKDIEKALKLLRRKSKQEGHYNDIKKKKYFEKPSSIRRRENLKAIKKAARAKKSNS
ncbi:MAG: 30S ribosomal protein S21, partial [Candidatus Schekmanbacteria bacterium RBG_13_48_7]